MKWKEQQRSCHDMLNQRIEWNEMDREVADDKFVKELYYQYWRNLSSSTLFPSLHKQVISKAEITYRLLRAVRTRVVMFPSSSLPLKGVVSYAPASSMPMMLKAEIGLYTRPLPNLFSWSSRKS